MEVDYSQIGKRIAQRRRELNLRQSEVEERADIGYKYLSNIERGISVPSIEVIMRLALALDTTPDEFLLGIPHRGRDELCPALSARQKSLALSFLGWLREQEM